eukprot:CAMPEP_0168531102 /NCGR_PEP_ID=MMETSP0405-20121227/15183_1 /TAXON_ID=498012 /ORGANISM="Trichosphaerium sp, Strain Am-I-7 wt" /LENGTH=831 /DNA_ID=CAMNT_0008555711 /DNA_START=485 /DNA_END=2980 /DNA_ORIENTATION=-
MSNLMHYQQAVFNAPRRPVPAYNQRVFVPQHAARFNHQPSKSAYQRTNIGHRLDVPTRSNSARRYIPGDVQVANFDNAALARRPVVIEFINDDCRCLGLLIERVGDDSRHKNTYWVITNKSQPAIAVEVSQITFQWPSRHHFTNYFFQAQDIPNLQIMCLELTEKYKARVPIAWGAFIDKSVHYVSTGDLAQFLFKEQPDSPKPHEYYVAHRLMSNDCVYFEETSRRHVFRCRTLKEVSERRRMELSNNSDSTIIFLHRVVAWLKKRSYNMSGAKLPSLPKIGDIDLKWDVVADKSFIDEISSYALVPPGHQPNSKIYSKYLKYLGVGDMPRGAFDLLVRLGVYSKHQNVNLLRYPHKLDFTPQQNKKYADLSAILDRPIDFIEDHRQVSRGPLVVDRDFEVRRDLTHVTPVLAIDEDINGNEIDDAIALHTKNGKEWVIIHIADPTRAITPNTELDLLARQRACSTFLPEASFSMFPLPLARNNFSLRQGKTNYSLSYAVTLAEDGSIDDYEICPAVVGAVTALSYNDADGMLNGVKTSKKTRQSVTDSLTRLRELADLRKAYRVRKGAVVLDMPSPQIRVADEDEPQIDLVVRYDYDSPSRSTVQELMIMVGEVSALFAKKHSIPIPYRTVDHTRSKSDASDTKVTAPNPLLAGYDKFMKLVEQIKKMGQLPQAVNEINPGKHSALALDQYCHATSPIRRYSDLLVHHQIKAVLRGDKPPFDKTKVVSIMERLAETSSSLSRLTQYSQRYWMLKYLEQKEDVAQSVWKSLVLSVSKKFSFGGAQLQVMLLDLAFRTTTFLPRVPEQGDVLFLKIGEIDAFNNVLRFEEV